MIYSIYKKKNNSHNIFIFFADYYIRLHPKTRKNSTIISSRTIIVLWVMFKISIIKEEGGGKQKSTFF